MSIYNQGSPGLGNAASYQVSGKPFATGSLHAPVVSGTPVRVEFPSVTRWVKVLPVSGSGNNLAFLRVGFSEVGVKNENYFRLLVGGASEMGDQRVLDPDPLELKVTELYFLSDDNIATIDFDVVAGLTGIDKRNITNNWSGSSGVG